MVRNKSSEITHDTCNIDNRNSLGVASRSGSNLRLGNNGSNSTSKIKKSLHKNNNNGH